MQNAIDRLTELARMTRGKRMQLNSPKSVLYPLRKMTNIFLQQRRFDVASSDVHIVCIRLPLVAKTCTAEWAAQLPIERSRCTICFILVVMWNDNFVLMNSRRVEILFFLPQRRCFLLLFFFSWTHHEQRPPARRPPGPPYSPGACASAWSRPRWSVWAWAWSSPPRGWATSGGSRPTATAEWRFSLVKWSYWTAARHQTGMQNTRRSTHRLLLFLVLSASTLARREDDHHKVVHPEEERHQRVTLRHDGSVLWNRLGTLRSLMSPSNCTMSSRRLSCKADMRLSSSSFLCLTPHKRAARFIAKYKWRSRKRLLCPRFMLQPCSKMYCWTHTFLVFLFGNFFFCLILCVVLILFILFLVKYERICQLFLYFWLFVYFFLSNICLILIFLIIFFVSYFAFIFCN